MEFASEMVVKSALARLQIPEVPTTLRPDGRSRPPHLRTWPDGWRHFKFLLMYSPRWLFITPGAVLTVLGALLASLLFFGPVHFGANVILDLNTFISACFLVVVGTQVMTVGAVSQYYATVTGLLPKSRRSEFLLNRIEHRPNGATVAVFLLIGIGLFGYAVHGWAEQNFGPLTSPFIPRMVVAGMSVVVIGLQTFFAAFLLGVLNIPLPAVSGMTVMRRNGSVRSALRGVSACSNPARCGRVGNQVSDRGVVKRHGIPGGRFRPQLPLEFPAPCAGTEIEGTAGMSFHQSFQRKHVRCRQVSSCRPPQ